MKNPDYSKVQVIIETLHDIDSNLNFILYSSEQSKFLSPKEKQALTNASESVLIAIKELLEIHLS